jgi:hypothetical protein
MDVVRQNSGPLVRLGGRLRVLCFEFPIGCPSETVKVKATAWRSPPLPRKGTLGRRVAPQRAGLQRNRRSTPGSGPSDSARVESAETSRPRFPGFPGFPPVSPAALGIRHHDVHLDQVDVKVQHHPSFGRRRGCRRLRGGRSRKTKEEHRGSQGASPHLKLPPSDT